MANKIKRDPEKLKEIKKLMTTRFFPGNKNACEILGAGFSGLKSYDFEEVYDRLMGIMDYDRIEETGVINYFTYGYFFTELLKIFFYKYSIVTKKIYQMRGFDICGEFTINNHDVIVKATQESVSYTIDGKDSFSSRRFNNSGFIFFREIIIDGQSYYPKDVTFFMDQVTFIIDKISENK